MSSENRLIAPKTFDSDVPPLNTKESAKDDWNNTPSIQHTQKSFSTITVGVPSLAPHSVMISFRSSRVRVRKSRFISSHPPPSHESVRASRLAQISNLEVSDGVLS